MNDFQAHGTDRISSWGPNGELKDYIIRFTNKLDPNGEGLGIPWPQWYPASPKALVLRDDADSPLIIANDTYRSLDLDYIADLSLRYPL
jgi:acetylcholinesterase